MGGQLDSTTGIPVDRPGMMTGGTPHDLVRSCGFMALTISQSLFGKTTCFNGNIMKMAYTIENNWVTTSYHIIPPSHPENYPHNILLYQHIGTAYGIAFAALLLGSEVPVASGHIYHITIVIGAPYPNL